MRVQDWCPRRARCVVDAVASEAYLDRDALAASLENAGFRPDEYRETLREEARDTLLGDLLVRTDRVIDDTALEAAFFQRYGEGGVKVSVRHIVLVPARVRAEEIARGTPAAELGADLPEVHRDRLERVARDVGGR